MKIRFVFISFILFLFTYSHGFANDILKYKNIVYLEANPTTGSAKQELNIFSPTNSKELKEVFIFIHGGSWKKGSKSGYDYLGKRMASRDVVTVIIDYPLIPEANYNEMAMDAAIAVKWVKDNIQKYGGNPSKLFVSGHSAGGHLAALISVCDAYFDTIGISNPIKGSILIDAAAINMYGYLKIEKFEADHYFFKVFTQDEENWKKASPLYHLHEGVSPMLIYSGEKTYPSILKSNEHFADTLKTFHVQSIFHVLKGKRHVQMITQLFWSKNPLYEEMVSFMRKQE